MEANPEAKELPAAAAPARKLQSPPSPAGKIPPSGHRNLFPRRSPPAERPATELPVAQPFAPSRNHNPKTEGTRRTCAVPAMSNSVDAWKQMRSSEGEAVIPGKTQRPTRKVWRRGSESNRRVKVLQTSPLPLGYRAPAPYVSVPAEKSPSAESSLGTKKTWSGRRGSNPRHRPWQGRALPLSYSRSSSDSIALAYWLTIRGKGSSSTRAEEGALNRRLQPGPPERCPQTMP